MPGDYSRPIRQHTNEIHRYRIDPLLQRQARQIAASGHDSKAVSLPCGSHTLTGARDGNRLIVYSNNSSSRGCVDGTRANDDPVGDFMDVIEVPLANPAAANLLRRVPLAGPAVDKSAFFYDARTGAKLGQWTLPRSQDGVAENCTIHNYNVVPLHSGRYVLASGNYQAGTWVADFTDPANPVTLGWSDPQAITPPDLGGAWSSYSYNNFLYESSITEGVNVYRFSGHQTAGAIRLPYLNPQTQPFSLP
ncbi:hypothetical protein K1W54_19435 [Micromonospora sp. CPCC 205371]|nr:hypothetical protein [Micromonospora sp. CPCC 205371]